MTSQRSSRMAGFTLLELIVAAAILALIAVFSWRGLDALVREREAIAASQEAIDVLQRSFARIERDALSAADVRLDDGGVLRFVAAASSVEGTPSASVEYRLVGGALTRSVEGVDRAPLVMLDHLASVSIEAWQPAPRGGAWVRTKGAAMEPQPAAQPGQPPNGAQPATNPSTPASTTPASPPVGTSPTGNAAQGNPVQQTGASVATATGVRFTFARADGQQVTRSFMVGGG